jgi:regulatory protein
LKRISVASIEGAAVHYLRRFSASEKRLRQVLVRKAKKTCQVTDTPFEVAVPLIETVVQRMLAAGYLDDAKLAASKAESLQRQGKGAKVVKFKLMAKGIDTALAAKASARSDIQELASASILVTKKRLGTDSTRFKKDLAVLLRAGFSFDIARRALQPSHQTID